MVRSMIDSKDKLPLGEQCQLLGISRSSIYYQKISLLDKYRLAVAEIDRIYTETPTYGARPISKELHRRGIGLSRCTVGKLMKLMGLEAIYPKRNLSLPHPDHVKFPYLLRGLEITAINQVWSTDITYIPLPSGHAYLTAIIDWYSRMVLAWRVSSTLDTSFCIEAFDEAVACYGKPLIFNTDQGSQFTSNEFVERVLGNDIRLSMDGKGRSLDNVFVERLWRTVKYEDIYLRGYTCMSELREGLKAFFLKYNTRRLHSSLGYKTPAEVHGLAACTVREVA
jgi:putative transposase